MLKDLKRKFLLFIRFNGSGLSSSSSSTLTSINIFKKKFRQRLILDQLEWIEFQPKSMSTN
ncbi:hypothetical protein DERP_010575 [Dermatophagoides pteronyssinus]|uniref:Uncharacterized protein n=1 Tax=Dermatophagoides pteronyssinus TaxID=6956 RepID=A0ABQ8JFR8_DERPT|nr:hypothetical protein DERP_010575 [Dermatophagoides pteronyssinus]